MNRPMPSESDIPMHGWDPYAQFHRERVRAHKKHEASGGSMELKDWDDPACLRITLEELGEVAKVLNDLDLGLLSREQAKADITTELVQLGAMVSAWAETAASRPKPIPRDRIPPEFKGL